ncbi:hypothetical protein J4573_23160 [Actinomadura barringtoniae]|uniref:Methylamine utilisation protein MauE domain-containing protein n=1 Tax=Actinomadura barringtoniae TaxID=1427535 RepID=A0A939T2Q0_9ACTN|nr:MauE/DoxX family redox-associated membrane protein [Actinomadura barringtoniae]MBO2450021.1 hypothetical protein [Actinomadura barringtoniae]
MEYLSVGCASLLALVFAVSAISKTRDLDGFVASMPDLLPRLSGGTAARPVGLLVVALEAIAAVLLVVPATAPYGFGLAFLMLAAFTVAIAAAIRRGRRAPCRCFGASAAPLGVRHLGRNAVLLAAAALGAFPAGSPGAAAGVAVAVAAGAVGAILIVSLDPLADLFMESP